MNYFNKIFARFKPAAKIDRQEIDNVMRELLYAKEELKRTQEKIKAANRSVKRANDKLAHNKEIDDKIKADRIESQKFWDQKAETQRKLEDERNRSLKLLREKIEYEEIRAKSEIKAIHQAIKDAALSRP